jgi:hypothetical protein
MTKIVNGNKIVQITKSKDCFIVWFQDNTSMRLDRTKKLEAAFDFGRWKVFDEAVKKLKGD